MFFTPETPAETLRQAVSSGSFARIRGMFDPNEIRRLLAGMRVRFDPAQDRKQDPADSHLVQTNFQKLQIGAASGPDHRRSLGRFLRVLYNPIFAEDIYGLRQTFVTLARFRNRLYGLAPDYAVFGVDDELFTCARINQYPVGGGFMVPHRDMFSRMATEQQGLGYFQVFMVMSEKGRDFQTGGAYVDVGEQRIMLEDQCEPGDVVVYDGRTTHGVADIDPLRPLDLQQFGGRVAAFASLFRVLGQGGYARLAQQSLERFGGG